MKKLELVLVPFLVLVMSGCATQMKLYPVKLEKQSSMYQKGSKVVISKKKNIIAIKAKEYFFSSERPTLVVSVYNATEQPFDFSTESISATIEGKPIRIFTYQELAKEIEDQRRSAAIAAALAGFSQVLAASTPSTQYHSGTVNSTYTGSGYTGYGTGTYSGYTTTYNPASTLQAQTLANAQMMQNMTLINQSANSSLNELENIILRKETVRPGTWFGGNIKLDRLPVSEDQKEILVGLNIENDVHQFKFIVMKSESQSKENQKNNQTQLNPNRSANKIPERDKSKFDGMSVTGIEQYHSSDKPTKEKKILKTSLEKTLQSPTKDLVAQEGLDEKRQLCINQAGEQVAALEAKDWTHLKRLTKHYIQDCKGIFNSEDLSDEYEILAMAYMRLNNTTATLETCKVCINAYYANAGCHVLMVDALIKHKRFSEAQHETEIAERLIDHLIKDAENEYQRTSYSSEKEMYSSKIEKLKTQKGFLDSLRETFEFTESDLDN